jgi:phospholipid-binding lipoprotein MlaA
MPCRLGAAVLAGAVLLAGCATTPPPAATPAAQPSAIDPWEGWNRKVYAFNEKVDAAVFKPVATAYRDFVPELVRTGVNNVLGNIRDVWSAANQLLQGKLQLGTEMGMRVLTNTVFGLGGLLDPATEMGLTRRSEDFGQTLGRWGLGNGPYIVLPVLGPSTLRDTAGFAVDRQFAASTLPPTHNGQYGVLALELVNTRTNLLSASQLLDEAALDKYSFLRDAYLARRRDALYDGAPPVETYDDGTSDAPPAPPGQAASEPGAGLPR